MTIGAGSLLRSCKVEGMCVIGERSIIMEGSVICANAILLPGTVVPPAKLIPSKEVWGGNPAQFVRKLTHDEVRRPLPACQRWGRSLAAFASFQAGNTPARESCTPREAATLVCNPRRDHNHPRTSARNTLLQ